MREREQNIREEEEGDEERNRTDERTEEYGRGEGVQASWEIQRCISWHDHRGGK